MSRTARLCLLALIVGLLPVLAIAIAGCGGGGGSTTVIETVTETTETVGTETGGGETTTGEEAPTSPEEKGGDETNGGDGGTLHLQSFQSPSGNIGCIMFEGGARCDIDKHSWTPPPRPASCSDQVDYGQGLAVSSDGGGTVVCAGDTAMNGKDPILAYGATSEVGGTSCVSQESGITCTNPGGGGFFISVQSFKLF
jgi:hypothetical protein